MIDADRTALRGFTQMLLEPRTTPARLQEAAARLYELCLRLALLEHAHPAQEPLRLAHGVALDPLSAARCTLDAPRTALFLRAVQAAIGAGLSRFGAPLRVLYAGCGPLAPLALPLTTVLPPDSVRLTLLDMHAFATDHLQNLVRAVGAEDWIEQLETADALEWQAPQPPHVIVVECMQQALTREPQAALMRHLAPQLAPGGRFVPQRIRLAASLADLRRQLGARLEEAPLAPDAPAYVELGIILDLRADALQRGEPLLDGVVQLTVPAYEGAERHLLVRTHVETWEGMALADGESGITEPLVMHALGHVAAGTRLEFSYASGPDPGPRVRILR